MKASDALARGVITVGGIGTIVAVLLVFFFLLYVALPLFFPARFSQASTVDVAEQRPVIHAGVDEFRLLSWWLTDDGKLTIRRNDSGESIGTREVIAGRKVECSAWSPESPHFLLGLDDGTALPGAIDCETKFLKAEEADVSPSKFGESDTLVQDGAIVERTPQGLLRRQTVVVKQESPISLGDSAPTALDFLRSEGSELSPTVWQIAAVLKNGEIVAVEAKEVRNLLTDEVEIEVNRTPVTIEKSNPPWRVFLVGRGTGLVAVWQDGRVVRSDLTASGGPRVVEDFNVLDGKSQLTAVMSLQGRSTIVFGDSAGKLQAWFLALVRRAGREEMRFVKGHELPPMNGAVVALARSRKLRMIAAGGDKGEVAVYHVTTEQRMAHRQAFDDAPVERILFGPNDDGLLAASPGKLWQADFEPEHPEATLSALMRPVWYENYDRPQHKWQSSSGSDEPEPKFGVMPLLFGTFKATLYSMLFGAPLALLAAIYTSEFVEPGLRGRLKSLVELMAGLPSVVLGFLGGLVLAPFVENIIPTILTSLFTIPFALLFGAQLWQMLPQRLAIRFAKFRLLGICLMLPLGALAAGAMSPYAETWLFAGDMKRWLSGGPGSGIGGWFVLMLPIALVTTAVLIGFFANPWLRNMAGHWPKERFAAADLLKFLASLVFALLAAWLAAACMNVIVGDPRGRLLDTYDQRNVLIVGFVMGFAIIPIIYTIAEDALSTVPQHLRSASLGCGATPWQTTWRVVIPTAMSGLFSAVMVGLGRAVGETMIVLMGAGNTPNFDFNPFNGLRSLSANIAEELPETAAWSTHFRILFFTALMLLAITFVINTAAEMVRTSFRKRTGRL